MKKKKYIMAYILGAALLFCSPLYGKAADTDENKSARNVKETTYTDENGVEKTIFWVDNITPPTMNGADDRNSDFKKVETSDSNGNKYVDYIAPYTAGKGWYDVNKTFGADRNLCFSAAASNMLHWWFAQNEDYIDKYLKLHPDAPKAAKIRDFKALPTTQYDSKIYNHFVSQFANRESGFWPDLLQDQFINGYEPKENAGATDPEWEGPGLIQNGPDKRGGFFYHVFGPDILTRRRPYDYMGSFQSFSNDLKSFIKQGDIVTLTYDMGASAHVVTLWGIECDSKGNLTGVYYTDSDDDKNEGMHRYRIVNKGGKPYVTTNTRDDRNGSIVTCLTTLSTGRSTWEKVTAQAGTELNLRWGKDELVYNGNPQKPELETWSIMAGDDAVLQVEGEATSVGTYTAVATLTGKDAGKYTLPADNKKKFTITRSGTRFDGGIKTYRGTDATASFELGDTITVKVSPRATGKKSSSVQAEPLASGVPTDGQMTLYNGGRVVSGPVKADGSGIYTLTCSVLSDNFSRGTNTLKAKFRGDKNMEDYEQTVTVTVTGGAVEEEYRPVAEVPPTCEKTGKKAHFTGRNGKLYIEENGKKKEVTEQELVLPAKNHRPAETWTQKNDRHYHECLNGCDVHLNEAACSGGTATTTERSVCKICGNAYGKTLDKPEEHVHGWDSKYTTDKKATCTEEGKQSIRCIECGIVKPGSERKIARLPHTYRTTIVKASMNKNGRIVNTCTVCKATVNKVIDCPKSVSLSADVYTYNGKTKTPAVKVKTSKGNLLSSGNYTVSYSGGRKNVGQYKVKVTFKGNYSGSITKTFHINPKKTTLSGVKAGKKKMTVKWKKQSKQVTGYQVQYSVNKKFKKGVKTSTIKKYKTTSASIGKLKAKKKYYVRVRTYKTVKINGKSIKLYSDWSKAKAVKIK